MLRNSSYLLKAKEGNIGADLKEIGVNTRNWGDLVQDRDCWRAFVNVELNLWVP